MRNFESTGHDFVYWLPIFFVLVALCANFAFSFIGGLKLRFESNATRAAYGAFLLVLSFLVFKTVAYIGWRGQLITSVAGNSLLMASPFFLMGLWYIISTHLRTGKVVDDWLGGIVFAHLVGASVFIIGNS